VLGVIIANELAEGPGPRWLSVAANGLRKQACPHGAIIQAFAVAGCNLEQRRTADNDCQQA
jgi:hypothetical protein